jgi:hypothetical protein
VNARLAAIKNPAKIMGSKSILLKSLRLDASPRMRWRGCGHWQSCRKAARAHNGRGGRFETVDLASSAESRTCIWEGPMNNRQMFSTAFLAILMFLGIAVVSDAAAQYYEGACGGLMRGYDGREYPCQPDRKPVCEANTGRCVCLLKRQCGANRDEGWYDQ